MKDRAVTSISLEFDSNELLPVLFGESNEHLAVLEKKLGIEIFGRGNRIHIEGPGEGVQVAEAVLGALWAKIQNHEDVGMAEVDAALRFARDAEATGRSPGTLPGFGDDRVLIKTKKKTVSPRSPMQANYVKAIGSHEMVFGLGPAGTGKTYLAVAMAVQAYMQGEVARMVFCRPALEAGERIGFLPGDMKEKIDPYLRPIYDALHDMMPFDVVQKKMDHGDIEIAPLAFMRGRTLSNSFVILDEAQNATPSQMKMFLTRMGEGSRMVVTGDPSQSDLPKDVPSGLSEAARILRSLHEVKFIEFSGEDVVRHALVHKIVDAYANNSKSA
ncbi:MAG: PhoH family protein [Alphaproteobacteria bacterium]|nr:PhoH family protein [Alphaproteobacteria bacterium]